MQLAQDLSSQLPDIARQVALPALLGGAGGGALAGYMSSKSRPMNEDPGARRRRILRNALVGVLLGGTAGATLPLGVKTLGGQMLGSSERVDPMASALGFGLRNAAPLAVLGGGGAYMHRLQGQERGQAMKQLLGQLTGQTVGKTRIRNEATLRQVLESGGRNDVLKALARVGTGASPERLLKGHELLGEAGYKGKLLETLLSKETPGNYWGKFKPKTNIAEAIKAHITGTSALPGAAKPYGLAGLISKSVGGEVAGRSTTPIAEAYLNLVRPSARSMIGRIGKLPRLGLLGGGVLAAKTLQDALMGQN